MGAISYAHLKASLENAFAYAHIVRPLDKRREGKRQSRDLSLEIPSNGEHAASISNIDALVIGAADECIFLLGRLLVSFSLSPTRALRFTLSFFVMTFAQNARITRTGVKSRNL